MKIKTKDLVMYACLGAILVIVQLALSFIPNVELVSLLIIVYVSVLGLRALFPVYVFVMIEGLLYGFGLWWMNYMYVWAILVLIAFALQKNRSVILWSIISGIFGLMFGFLCSLIYLFIGGYNMAFSYFISGIPFDILHGIGNVVVMLLLYKPLRKILVQVKNSGTL